LITAIAVNDPPRALALAQPLQLSWQASENLVGAVFDPWIGRNPHEAASHAEQLPDGELRGAALRRVAQQWARVDLPNALAWADSVPGQDFGEGRLNSFGTGPLFSVLRTWIESDASASVRWLQQLPEGEKRASLISSACTFFGSGNPTPELATQLALLLPEGALRDDTIQQFAHSIAWWEPDAALAWVREQKDPHLQKVFLSGLLSHLSGSDLARALEFAQTIDPSGKGELIRTSAQGGRTTWGLADHQTLAGWAMRQPNNQEYLNRIAASWVNTDANAAAEWLRSLPPDARDRALRGIVDEALFRVPVDSAFVTATHFQNAERWIAQLSDKQTQISCYENMAKAWLSIDSEAARAWLNLAPLPPEVKARLAKGGSN
jgi:hypothetical protein